MKQTAILEPPLTTRTRFLPFFRSSSGLLWTCLFLVWIADIFFFKQSAGWTLAAFLSLLTAAVVAFRSRNLKKQERILIALIAGLILTLLEEPATLPALLTMAALFSLSFAQNIPLERWPRIWIHFAFAWWIQPLRDLLVYRKWRRSGHGHPIVSRLTHSAAVWILPILLSLSFVWLFSIANPLISRWITAIELNLSILLQELDISFERMIFWLLIASFSWALLRFRTNKKKQKMAKPKTDAKMDMLGPELIIRCLTLFNLIFAVQSALDILYLWGGKQLPGGMTYAEYAHRGAYPLIFTALLSALFVLVTFRQRGVAEKIALTRYLVFLWLAQNVFLTISSLWRLHLYVDVYSLTRLRIAAAIWMFLVATGLVLIALRILRKQTNQWLVRRNILMLATVLYFCCFLNFDGWIAWHNVRNCREVTGKGASLDLAYLRYLGPESIPALLWLSRQPSGITGFSASIHAQHLQKNVKHQMRNWRGWTFRRHRLLTH